MEPTKILNNSFSYPYCFTVDDSNGNLFISDYLHDSIQVFNSKGDHYITFGKQGKGNSEFNHPR